MKSSSRTVFAAAITLALTLVSSSIALGDDWMPLGIGTRWEYRSVGGDHQVQTITGQTIVRGRVVAVKSYAEGVDAGLQNYWLLDADGSVLLAGFSEPSAAFALAYEPPVRYLPVPPEPGLHPAQHIVAHDLFTDAVFDAFDIQIELTGDVLLTLPIGIYHAVGVGQAGPPAGPALAREVSYTLDGRRLPHGVPSGSATTSTDWFSNGVGDVMYQSSDLFQLIGFGQPTPTAKTTWSAIKRLYH